MYRFNDLIVAYLNDNANENRVAETGKVQRIMNLRKTDEGDWAFDISYEKCLGAYCTVSQEDLMGWMFERLETLESKLSEAN
jgi:hypothetical protein